MDCVKLQFPFVTAGFSCVSGKEFISNCEIIPLENGYRIRNTIKNDSEKVLQLSALEYKFCGMTFGGESKEDYFYCNENARLFNTLTIPVDYNRLDDDCKENEKFGLPVDRRWCDPRVKEGDICSSPYQPFPAILLSNYQSSIGIVCGSLSQKVFCHTYKVLHENKAVTLVVVR